VKHPTFFDTSFVSVPFAENERLIQWKIREPFGLWAGDDGIVHRTGRHAFAEDRSTACGVCPVYGSCREEVVSCLACLAR
jgi:hypothetical protein